MGRPRKYETPEERRLARKLRERERRSAKKNENPDQSTKREILISDFSQLPDRILERLGLIYDPREEQE